VTGGCEVNQIEIKKLGPGTHNCNGHLHGPLQPILKVTGIVNAG
jgi:hypothetical protein